MQIPTTILGKTNRLRALRRVGPEGASSSSTLGN